MEVNKKSQIKKRIENVLKHKQDVIHTAYSKSLEELVEELKVYQYELEFQNEELQRVHEELEISRDQYKQLFFHAPMGYVVLDMEYLIMDCNDTFRNIVQPIEPCKPRIDFRKFIEPASQDKFHFYWKELTESGSAANIEINLLNLTGAPIVVQIHGVYRSEPGAPRILLALLDITEQYHARADLAASEAKFNTLVTRMSQGLALHRIICNDKGVPVDYLFLDVNKTFETMTGLKRHEVVGKTVKEVYSDLDEIWLSQFGKVALTGVPVSFESYSTPLKKFFSVIAYQTLPGEFAVIVTDISDRVASDELIVQKNSELALLNSEKDKLFSIIAHDLRSPFNNLLGMTSLLVDELHDMSVEEIRQTATMLQTSSTVLFRLIENLLQWSRIQLGSLNVEPVETDLLSLLEESLLLVREAAVKKNIEIRNNVLQGIPLLADPNILQTVLRNLLFNAVKFTRKGGIVSVTAFIRDEHELVVKIKDNGVGMRAEILENLFHKSNRETTRGTEGESGTGLGLILCKELIERHQGRIWATSEPEKGSTFCFSLPLNFRKP